MLKGIALVFLVSACGINAYVTNRVTTERPENIANLVVLPGEIREPTSEEINVMIKNLDEENPPVTTESTANKQLTISHNRMSITLTYGQLFRLMAEWQLKQEKEFYESQFKDFTRNDVGDGTEENATTVDN